MPKDVKLDLIDSVDLFNKTVRSITIREPKGRQYLQIGEPRMLARNADGTAYWVEDRIAIAQYLETCVVQDDDTLGIIEMLSLVDARRARDAVLGFFSDADVATIAKSLPPSSSAPA